jgi:ABC-type transport system involved in multi-copper enzyme maturation permease subunit
VRRTVRQSDILGMALGTRIVTGIVYLLVAFSLFAATGIGQVLICCGLFRLTRGLVVALLCLRSDLSQAARSIELIRSQWQVTKIISGSLMCALGVIILIGRCIR